MDEHSPQVVSRQARALRILTVLQSGPAVNANDLAERLNVSRRTIYRDLRLIRAAGVRLYFDEQEDGYRLALPSQVVEPPQFDVDELAQFVVMAHMSLLQNQPGFLESGRELALKLLCSYPYTVRTAITRLLNACVFQVPDPPAAAGSTLVLQQFLEAIRRQKQLRLVIDPRKEGEMVVRTRFSPFRLDFVGTNWSTFGRSTAHRGPVRLCMDVVHSAVVTTEHYEIPRNFRNRPR